MILAAGLLQLARTTNYNVGVVNESTALSQPQDLLYSSAAGGLALLGRKFWRSHWHETFEV